jgi:hypothetical protein
MHVSRFDVMERAWKNLNMAPISISSLAQSSHTPTVSSSKKNHGERGESALYSV